MNVPLKKIVLYGELGRLFGKYWKLRVRTPAEAIRVIIANKPEFGQYLLESAKLGIAFKAFLAHEPLTEKDQFRQPFSSRETIRIVPVMAGAGGGNGLFGIVLGVALIAFSGGIAGALGGLLQASTVASIGVGLALTGVSSLLADKPQPKENSAGPAPTPSFNFSGTVNTTVQGNCVPVMYGGPMIVGSAVISAGIVAQDLIVPPPTVAPTPPVDQSPVYNSGDPPSVLY